MWYCWVNSIFSFRLDVATTALHIWTANITERHCLIFSSDSVGNFSVCSSWNNCSDTQAKKAERCKQRRRTWNRETRNNRGDSWRIVVGTQNPERRFCSTAGTEYIFDFWFWSLILIFGQIPDSWFHPSHTHTALSSIHIIQIWFGLTWVNSTAGTKSSSCPATLHSFCQFFKSHDLKK